MENRTKRLVFFLSLLVARYSPALSVANVLLKAAEVSRMQVVMGTLLQIEVSAPEKQDAEKAIESAFEEVQRLDNLLSNYKKDSEISRINREAYPSGTATTDEMILFLSQAQKLSELTSGYFDLTVEPLTQLWRIRERKLERMPSKEEIETARAKVNYKNMEISSSAKVVRFLQEGMGIDTGGIGKGYALDKALEKIKKFPVESCTLNFGGQILYWSKHSQKRKLAIKNPLQPEKVWKKYSLTKSFPKLSVSSSGNYERYVVFIDSATTKNVGHIFDPKTGAPVENKIRSVTLVSYNAMVADALSTAIFAMGFEQGKKFADQLISVGVLFLYETEDGKLVEIPAENWKLWLESSKLHWSDYKNYISKATITPLEYLAEGILAVAIVTAEGLGKAGASVGVGRK